MTQEQQQEGTPAGTGELQVTLDTQEIANALNSLTELLELTFQIRQGLLHVLNTPSNIGSVQFHGLSTPGTAPLRATFQPTESFLNLATAVRAGNIQLCAIKEILSHISPPLDKGNAPAPAAAEVGA